MNNKEDKKFKYVIKVLENELRFNENKKIEGWRKKNEEILTVIELLERIKIIENLIYQINDGVLGLKALIIKKD